MLRFDVELLLGTFRGAPADDLALTGRAVLAEWPPSPARLFSALVAAGGDERVAHAGALDLLEQAPAPSIDATTMVEHTPLHGRYVVEDRRAEGSVQEYPLRRAVMVRPGVRLSAANPNLSYWWAVNPDDAQMEELRLRAARVGYLGTSDTPVRMTVQRDEFDKGAWRPADHGSHLAPVPYPGFLTELDRWFHYWQSGNPVRRAWVRTELARYANPNEPAPNGETPTRVFLRFGRPVSGRFVRSVAEALRYATFASYDRLFGDVSAVLHGHERSRPHVAWLPLPFVDHRNADGGIRGACVVIPPETDAAEIGRIRQALGGVERVWNGRAFDVDVEVHDGSTRPWSVNPSRWTRRSRVFATAFPFVHERFSKRGPSFEDLSSWIRLAGLPAPVDAMETRVPLLRGALDLAPHEVHRPGSNGPYGHLRVVFDEPVEGPVAIGRLRHFGLGLLVPITREPDHE